MKMDIAGSNVMLEPVYQDHNTYIPHEITLITW